MFDNYFQFDERGSDFKTEILAGITTFLARAYILGVNPTMLAEGGMPAEGVFCATALSAGIATIIMGLVAKYPVGLAPGMGLNALFTYTFILEMGNTWETALAAVFVSSLVFLVIILSGLGERIVNIIPTDLKLGIGAGIGFYLAFLGLKSAGIIVDDPSTLVAMGNLFAPSSILALIGILITLMLHIKKIPAAVFIGMIITAVIGVVMEFFGFGVGNTLMPTLPAHFISFKFDLSLIGGFARGFGQLFNNIPNLLMMVFSVVFITFFDASGTLFSLAKQCGFVDEEGNVVGIKKAFLGDALGGIIGSFLGTSTVVVYVESATGVGMGAKTGLAAIVTGILFLFSIFFSPLVLSLFTSPVTAAALIIVGIMMMNQLMLINWKDIVVVSLVFITIIMMILSYSISLGIACGFLTFTVAKIAKGEFKELSWGIHVLVIIFIIYLFFGL